MSDTRIYFIGSARSSAVKIGVSDDPRKRLAGMQTGNAQRLILLAEIPGDERYEKSLHRAFAEYRIRGEWFRREGRLAAFIDLLPVMEIAAPAPKRRGWTGYQKPDKKELAELRRKQDAMWSKHLPLIREAVFDIGAREFAELVSAQTSDVVRSLYPDRGRHFRLSWFMYLIAILPREKGIALATPLVEHLGFRLVTPEEAAQEALEAARVQALRAQFALHGDRGLQALAQVDAEIEAEIARRRAAKVAA